MENTPSRGRQEIGDTVGLAHMEISTRSLRASGAMALLLGGINVIKIIGQWKSDKVFRYLHVSARSINHNHAKVMRQHGQYNLLAPTEETQQMGT